VLQQMDKWASSGVIEPDTANAIHNLTPTDVDLSPSNNSDWVFVVMGAGAAMGPLDTLLSMGATVIALDLPIPSVWKRLFDKARKSKGSIIFPMIHNGSSSGGGEALSSASTNDPNITEEEMESIAGCNLLTQIPEIISWLLLQCPTKRLVLGSYAYLDSAAFVTVSLAMDAVASEVLRIRKDSALAYLCSPTDVFAIPHGARDESRKRFYERGTWAQSMIQTLSRERVFEQNVVEETRHGSIPIVDCQVLQQGPNYFLAKRLQHWRAMVSRYGDNSTTVVSSNVAPASFTKSVLSNKLFGIVFSGAHNFPPVEIFQPETSNVLMTYLLLHDLKEQTTNKNNDNTSSIRRRSDLVDHPLNLFATTPVHNGFWRLGFQIRSLLELVVAYYFIDKVGKSKLAAAAVGVGAAAVMRSRL